MSWLEQVKMNTSQENTETERSIHHTHIDRLVRHYKDRLIKEANLEEIITLSPQEKKKTIERFVMQMIDEEKVIIPRSDIEGIIQELIYDSVGFGPLESLLERDDVTEIMVNGPKDIYIERNGRLEKTNVRFKDDDHIRHIIDRIIAPIGRRIDESSPMVDARLPDGSRVNAAIPPVSIDGPIISIRKFNKDPFSLQDLITFGTLTEDMGNFLQALVASKTNILVSGGTGSGKTTLLNVLSSAIPQGERIVTIEDMAELQFSYDNLVRMEARPPNMEGEGEITIRHLVRNALRMRPDRIIVGEVRGSEALDMLQAMNTGHEGSLTTVHANSPKDALGRLEAMVIMSGLSLTVDVIRDYFVGAIDMIVQTERLMDGKRRIVAISEVCEENGKIQINDIFQFKKTGMTREGVVEGYFQATGYVPKISERLVAYGQTLPPSFFKEGQLA
ncbi:CpaF family protein [Aliibacillus thermotolerans]|uniref:CpaF family protein n=1 Tax=Aliibacillus thermotolerans TaxID=1834418 RepID=A0ABW0U6F4_9BACI|nr:CpaF family protein [Aliibacillus thermotolerans]